MKEGDASTTIFLLILLAGKLRLEEPPLFLIPSPSCNVTKGVRIKEEGPGGSRAFKDSLCTVKINGLLLALQTNLSSLFDCDMDPCFRNLPPNTERAEGGAWRCLSWEIT